MHLSLYLYSNSVENDAAALSCTGHKNNASIYFKMFTDHEVKIKLAWVIVGTKNVFSVSRPEFGTLGFVAWHTNPANNLITK